MKKQNHATASIRSQFSVLRQICNLIPNHLVPELARATGTDVLCRTFSAWSHSVALLFAQLTHALGLNDVCDSLRLHSGPLSTIRGATPPSRNNLSHANKRRPAQLAQSVFWSVLAHGASFQGGHPCRGCDDHRTHRLVHGLGQASPQEGGGEVSSAPGSAQPVAALCHHRHGARE